jgi:GAF domain-containing protein
MSAKSEMFIVNSALDAALAVTGQKLGNVQLVDWKEGWLEIAAHRGFSQEFLNTFRRVRSSDGCACARALLLRDTVLIEDVNCDLRFPALASVGKQAGFVSVQSTPLVSSNGALLGVISTHGSRRPTDRQLEHITTLARRAANELVHLRGIKIPMQSVG